MRCVAERLYDFPDPLEVSWGGSGDNITTHTEIPQSTQLERAWEISMTTEIVQSTHNYGGPGKETGMTTEILQKKLTLLVI